MFCIFFSFGVVGVTLFKNTTTIDDTHDYMSTGQGNANFDTLTNAMITLIQGFVGQGFYEIMFATMDEHDIGWITCLYMVIYYLIMSLLCGNLFFGLLLSIFGTLYNIDHNKETKYIHQRNQSNVDDDYQTNDIIHTQSNRENVTSNAHRKSSTTLDNETNDIRNTVIESEIKEDS